MRKVFSYPNISQ